MNPRNQAEGYMRDGVAYIAAAFNLTGARAWDFDRSKKEEALRLLADLKSVFEESSIRLSAAAGSVQREVRDRAAMIERNRDPAFVDFMYVLTVQAKDGSFVGRRAYGNRRKSK